MKAAYYKGNQSVEVGSGSIEDPGPDQVRIQVAYCGVCGTDLHIFQGHMDQRVATPLVMGHEMAGTIAAVGANASAWKEGDAVVVRPLDPCGDCPACRAGHSSICQNLNFLGIDTPGAFQGSWTVPAFTLHRLPEGVGLDLGALVEPLAVACHDVRLGEVQAGEFAVVIGGGPIGTLVSLVARQRGAQVLISEVNPFRLDFARKLGFEAIDPRQTDLLTLVQEKTGGAGADVVFEVSGSAAGAKIMTELPRTRGRMVVVAIFSEPPPVDLFRFFWRELRLCGVRVYEPEDYDTAIELIATNALPLDQLITHRYGLDGLQRALEQMAAGDPVMKVVIDTQQ